eukprot:CAMPEP_0118935644 /NCGR_PEP_ID=MMETSP1169-20130426/15756_1 /TAXON_ID=36882 /ORGANISM="Pyramimonas obovata, Strain CCMP722" /LENGTH=490 /DNA_ID=CAMNT_0006878703 /DNA_START=78 /DNA_END=1551 /DNA_ORIENTATION=-
MPVSYGQLIRDANLVALSTFIGVAIGAALTAYVQTRARATTADESLRRVKLYTAKWRERILDVSNAQWLQELSKVPGKIGLDIGGTLAKVVMALPDSAVRTGEHKKVFGLTGGHHEELTFTLQVNGAEYSLVFASGATHQLERATHHIKDLLDKSLGVDSPYGPPRVPGNLRRITAAGGGAHKFKKVFEEVLGVELIPQKELKAVVDGLLLLNTHGPANELFTVQPGTGAVEELEWPEELFPFLVVNMGSGVSVLKVNRPGPDGYERVGGTACGGATFLGLCTLLTSANSFEEALRLAERGNAQRVDTLVGDIYGPDGAVDLNMPASVTAANFGKLATKMVDGNFTNKYTVTFTEADLARATLQMVTQASVVLVRAFMLERVVFVGGFLENNPLARQVIAGTMRSLGGTAWFLQHSDFLGALGSLAHCLVRVHRCQVMPGDPGMHAGESKASFNLKGAVGEVVTAAAALQADRQADRRADLQAGAQVCLT